MQHFKYSGPVSLDEQARIAIEQLVLQKLRDHVLETEPLAEHLLEYRKTNHFKVFDELDFMIWFLEEIWGNRQRLFSDEDLLRLLKRLHPGFNLKDVLREFRVS